MLVLLLFSRSGESASARRVQEDGNVFATKNVATQLLAGQSILATSRANEESRWLVWPTMFAARH
jgi:hypothetical protein